MRLWVGTRPSDFFRCPACRKLHVKESGVCCPCGEPFPREVRFEVYR